MCDIEFEGKGVVITGGSSGIGLATAQAFAADGAEVFILDAHPRPGTCDIQCNVANYRNVWACLRKIKASRPSGTIDILVTCAGINGDNALLYQTEKQWDRVLRVNLNGTRHAVRAVLELKMMAKGARIVTVSSIMGLVGCYSLTNYCASKAGVIAFTKSMSGEVWKRFEGAINVVEPGFITTPMTERMKSAARDAQLKRIPCGRFGEPEEVADVIRSLCSKKMRYVNGAELRVDQGATNW